MYGTCVSVTEVEWLGVYINTFLYDIAVEARILNTEESITSLIWNAYRILGELLLKKQLSINIAHVEHIGEMETAILFVFPFKSNWKAGHVLQRKSSIVILMSVKLKRFQII